MEEEVKEKRKARNSNLEVDGQEFELKRKEFEWTNRRRRSSFKRRSEATLKHSPNGSIEEHIKSDNRKREEQRKLQESEGKSLDAENFTHFMGNLHNQAQDVIELKEFNDTAWERRD